MIVFFFFKEEGWFIHFVIFKSLIVKYHTFRDVCDQIKISKIVIIKKK